MKNESRSVIEAQLDLFRCSKNLDVEGFLRGKAIIYERANQARTYLVVDEHDGGFSIMAYFTLALHSMVIDERMSRSRKKKLIGLHFDIDEKCPDAPCYLIGQLGRDDNCNPSRISGHELLDWALDAIDGAKSYVGGRFVKMDSIDIPAIIELYRNHGFIEAQRSNDGLIEMVLFSS